MEGQEMWMRLSTFMFVISIFDRLKSEFFPAVAYLLRVTGINKLFDRKIDITFSEFIGTDYWKTSRAYQLLEAYLGPKSERAAKRMKGQLPKYSKKLSFTLADFEDIVDVFQGIGIQWYLHKYESKSKYQPERRELRLRFDRKHRETIMTSYLDHVLKEGKTIMVQNRRIQLYSNNPAKDMYEYGNKLWSHGVFDHPVTFKHLAMDPKKKQEIIEDLITFSKGKDYYAELGKPWKRGYLLYGPPGTGKSSMVAAMSNLLDYDVYDIELTAVKNNSELRKLLQNTTDKCIIAIEDIDCSLNLTGKRKKGKKKKKKSDEDSDSDSGSDSDSDDEKSKVTLSGLLNFIDGLWSACGKERIIVFTTNHVDKLDPALIRRGRMDKHIEMSYCCFEGFKVLAKNYLRLDSHELFETIRSLIGEVQMTPADVAEHLMPKTVDRNPEKCLEDLIRALENKKEETGKKQEAKEDEQKKEEAKEEEIAEAKEEEETREEAEEKEEAKAEAEEEAESSGAEEEAAFDH
ncbi:hypothetical protein MKW94_002071 [Papaver nudicaule]|uniref:AAA+ ATPase domain-containing protein n=1 Tax=Papaver nudicaule TaxID=74823 RepID=A0AA41S2A4_PAPNU|nr:hypothetical protein [Papaver nudicaule]